VPLALPELTIAGLYAAPAEPSGTQRSGP